MTKWHGWFHMLKSINATDHINKLKKQRKKDHFNRCKKLLLTKNTFLKNTLSKRSTEGNILTLRRASMKNLQITSHLLLQQRVLSP